MQHYAGLDLSAVDLYFLAWKDCIAIRQAFIKNYTKLHGSIDYQPAEQVISLLRRYIKMNFVAIGLLASHSTSADDMRMVMAIRMLPIESQDPVIKATIAAINTMTVRDQIYAFRAQPFSIDSLQTLWDIIEPEKEKLNLTGFWNKSAHNLYDRVGHELLKVAMQKLAVMVTPRARNPEELALRYILLFRIYEYIKQREQGYDFRYGFDVGKTKRDLHTVSATIVSDLKRCIQALRDIPEHGSRMEAAGLMLYRFSGMFTKHLPGTTESTAPRIAPE